MADLSGYAGKQVEVSISYATDWSTQGLGVFVDDARVIVDGQPVATTGFETDLGGWTRAGTTGGLLAEQQRLVAQPARRSRRARW